MTWPLVESTSLHIHQDTMNTTVSNQDRVIDMKLPKGKFLNENHHFVFCLRILRQKYLYHLTRKCSRIAQSSMSTFRNYSD